MSAWLKHILVPVDLSPLSYEALRYAAFLADVYDASLHVLHVVPADGGAPLASRAAGAKRRIEAVLDETPMGSPGSAHVIVARDGEHGPSPEALQSAYDLVVLPGDCGRGGGPGGRRGCSLIRRVLASSEHNRIRVEGPVCVPFSPGPRPVPHYLTNGATDPPPGRHGSAQGHADM